MRVRRIAATGLLGLLPAFGAQAAQFGLAWDQNVEPDLAGYRLYYDTDGVQPFDGTFFAEGSSPIDIPIASLADPTLPGIRVTGVDSCVHVYFAVTAYNSLGLESEPSATIEATALAKPSTVAVSAAGPGALELTWAPLLPVDRSIDTFRVLYDYDPGEPYEGTGAVEGPSPIAYPFSALDPDAPRTLLTGLPNQSVYLRVMYVCQDGTTSLSPESIGLPGLPTGDAGLPDVPPLDTGVPDVGIDTGGLDAGEPLDSGVPIDPDAATPDVYAPDSITLDAGSGLDALVGDAEEVRDASSPSPSDSGSTVPALPAARAIGGGCGCDTTESGRIESWLYLALAVLLKRSPLRKRRI